MNASTCPHCGTTLPPVSDVFCSVCQGAIDEPPEVAATDTDQGTGLVSGPMPRGDGIVLLSRHLQVAGWILVVWGGLGVAIGFVHGPPYVLAFFILVLVMGWQAVRCGAVLRKAVGADLEVIEVVGKSYVRQVWLVVIWLVLQIAFAVYMAILPK